ncbi:hypothetical protein B0H16DRAFT_1717734 [Mycena metata]|uniref:Uncharacterized protein n=1 Tax=Mycena metata TaxID=1033252 RepID=A0AAD7JHW0_9AGAR|nr:hypothetical protein B0H16DRAFT_1717734 [Mycena metata]
MNFALPANQPLPTVPAAPVVQPDDDDAAIAAATAAHWREVYLRNHHRPCQYAAPDSAFAARMASVRAGTDPETSDVGDPCDALLYPHIEGETLKYLWACSNPVPTIQPMGTGSRRDVLDDGYLKQRQAAEKKRN